jgi:hypothetical protein
MRSRCDGSPTFRIPRSRCPIVRVLVRRTTGAKTQQAQLQIRKANFIYMPESTATLLPLGCLALGLPIFLRGFPLVLRCPLLIFLGRLLGLPLTVWASVNLSLHWVWPCQTQQKEREYGTSFHNAPSSRTAGPERSISATAILSSDFQIGRILLVFDSGKRQYRHRRTCGFNLPLVGSHIGGIQQLLAADFSRSGRNRKQH